MNSNPADSVRTSEISSSPLANANVGSARAGGDQQSSPVALHVIIEAEDSRLQLDLRDLWRYRELLYFLTWRDVKIRYKQTLLGALWAIIQPLFTMILFTIVFGRLAHVPSDNVPYPLFAYTALLPWTFLANAITNSSNSLIGSTTLITKVYFPRVIIPAAPVLAGLVDLAIAFLLLAPMLMYYHIGITWRILLLPLLVLLTALLAFAAGMWTAAVNVKYRDVRYALPFLIQLLMFASPIIYPATIAPTRWQWLLRLNPVTGVVGGFRSALLARSFDWPSIAIATALTALLLILSFIYFRRVEDNFADVI